MRSFGSCVQFVLDDAREKGADDGAGRAPMVLEARAEHAATDEADGLGRRRREHAVAGELRAERDYMRPVSAAEWEGCMRVPGLAGAELAKLTAEAVESEAGRLQGAASSLDASDMATSVSAAYDGKGTSLSCLGACGA
jgi:hypothetical protein